MTNAGFTPPFPQEIPIVITSSLYELNRLPAGNYSDLQECGFNIIMSKMDSSYDNQAEIDDAFLKAAQYNMKLILGGWNNYVSPGRPSTSAGSKNNITDFINLYKDKYYLGGWYFKSEIQYNDLEDLEESYINIVSADNDHLALLTITPSNFSYNMGYCQYQPEDTKSTSEETEKSGSDIVPIDEEWKLYMGYMTKVQEFLKPSMLSFEKYPFSKSILVINPTTLVIDYKSFYCLLKIFSDRALFTHRPFWFTCTSKFPSGQFSNIPSFTLGMLRFMVFSALGYGAQGIVYSNYRGDNSGFSLINPLGKHTILWKYCHTVNQEIKKYNDIFVNCEITEIRHTGNAVPFVTAGPRNPLITLYRKYPYGKSVDGEILYRDTYEQIGPLENVEVTTYPGNNSNTKGVMISSFRNGSEKYVMILNHDVEDTVSVKVTFIDKCTVSELTPTLITDDNATPENKVINRILDPGSYLIFHWNYL